MCNGSSPTTLQEGGETEIASARYRLSVRVMEGQQPTEALFATLLFLNLRDCLDPTRFRGGKRNLVASVHAI